MQTDDDFDLASTRAGQADTGSGDLALDFANTADWHAGPAPVELLNTHKDLIAWFWRVGLIGEQQAKRLLAAAMRRPGEAKAALERAIILREVLYRVFSAVAHEMEPAPDDVATLNRYLNEALSHLGLGLEAQPEGGRAFAWIWSEPGERLDALLWPVVRSAADLLTSPRVARVRECEGDPCGWLFLDNSRNRSRRWCSMEDCGNRAKARRHYARARAALQSPAE